MRDGLIIIRKLNFPRLWLVPKKLFFLTNSLAKLSVGRFIIRQLFAVCTAQQADTDCSVSASRPFKRKFSATMLQIYEFSNLLCVIVLVILFFLIKMEGSLPAREPTENDEPLGYVKKLLVYNSYLSSVGNIGFYSENVVSGHLMPKAHFA